MTASYYTLAQILTITDRNLADRQISDVLNSAPFLKILAADKCPDTVHKYVKQTGAPVVGFRVVNDGRENSKSADQLVSIDLKYLDWSFVVDIAAADAFTAGRDAFVAREALRHLKAALFAFEVQIINGTVGGAAAGFAGLADSLVLANNMVINATGSTAGTGSSVYAIRTGGDLNDVVAIAGKNGDISIGETTQIEKAGATTGTYTGLLTPGGAWLGVQVGGAYSVGRIANLTAQAGKTLNDGLISQLISKFPADAPPTHLVMNRRSLQQLQAARTATNATGAPAPFPSESFNIPIVVTDSISSTETILT